MADTLFPVQVCNAATKTSEGLASACLDVLTGLLDMKE